MIGIDPGEFHRVRGHYATGVAIVTAADPAGGSVGVTVNSFTFTSVSLAPELVLFSLARTLRSLPAFLDAKHYGINILTAKQRELSARFATGVADKWSNIAVGTGEHGVPLIDEALASLECKRHSIVEGGDHLVFICRIVDLGARSDNEPLLYFRGNYWRRPEIMPDAKSERQFYPSR